MSSPSNEPGPVHSSKRTPTPARLSSISTNLLTSILELSHQDSLEMPINMSLKTSVVKNLISLRDGLIQIEKIHPSAQNQLVSSLRNQYLRIVSLVRGLGQLEQEINSLNLELPVIPLIQISHQDDQLNEENRSTSSSDSDRTMKRSSPPSADLHSHSDSINVPPPNRSTTRYSLEEDVELMKDQNKDVQLMQRALMEDQDRTLDELSTVISRQRDLSIHISSELEVQSNLLNELDDGLDSTGFKLNRANRRMNNLFTKIAKDGACWTIFGLVGFLLFLIVLLK